jgi:hypothetical protein
MNNRNLRLSPPRVTPSVIDGLTQSVIITFSWSMKTQSNYAQLSQCNLAELCFEFCNRSVVQTHALDQSTCPRLTFMMAFIEFIFDVRKLAIVFPTEEGEEELIGLSLVLPTGWKPHPCSPRQLRHSRISPTASFGLNNLASQIA